jgi:hypothetical protein
MADDGEEQAAEPIGVPVATTSVISDDAWSVALGSWIDAHVRNSPVASATEAWNHLMSVLPNLRARLETELGKKE